MPNATTPTLQPASGAKGQMTLAPVAATAATMPPSANSKVVECATSDNIGCRSPTPTVMPDSAMPKRKPKARAKVLLVMPLNHSQVRVSPPTQGTTTKPLPTQGFTAAPLNSATRASIVAQPPNPKETSANLRPGTAQASAGAPPPSPKGPTTVLRPADTQGPATTTAGGHRMPTAMPNSSPKAQASATAVVSRPISRQAARPPTQAPTATLTPATVHATTSIPPPGLKGPTTVPPPATTPGLTTTTTLNPAAPVFVPSSKGHKTLAAAAMNLSGDKKIPAPTNNAGGRCIPAIRPPSARPVPRARARAVNVRPINRPPTTPQRSRAAAVEVRPIGRQWSQVMPCPPTAQWPAMVQGAAPAQGPATILGRFAAPRSVTIQRRAGNPPSAVMGAIDVPRPAATQTSSGAPFFVLKGNIDVPRPAIAQGPAVIMPPITTPQQGYPAPPEFQPVRPIIPLGRVDPWDRLFNGETPHEQVWPRTFGPGQPHTAAVIRRLQDQEFLPRPGWWAWLEFENCYHQMPFN